ncbi:MAG: signal peptide peptidase SppA [Balneolia bacterium]|nr:signal peptide peptidase SppA [Balneolia bacterium]
MIDFIKQIFASAIGFILVVVVFFFFLFILFVSTSSDPEPTVQENSVLYVKTSGVIPERVSSDPLDQFFSPSHPASASLQNFDNNLRKAAVDDNIEGVLLEVDFVGAPWPILQHMRRSIERFREDSGKFVYATTNDLGLNEQGYYLATAADSIFAPPHTMMQMDGFVVEGTFFASMLEKIGVEATVIHKGAYKSAGDSFQRTSFSDADREQLTAIFSDIVDEFESAIENRTGMSREEVQAMINQPPRLDIEHYAGRGLIDAVIPQNELHNRIKSRIGVDADDDLRLVPNRRYARVSDRGAGLSRAPRESVAVIYASGPIMPMVDQGGLPFGGESTITIDGFKRSLDQALEDRNVKAIVVRIDSPGGSGSTSDAIWKLLREAAEQKPVITSMGAVAASGGYYIAMAGDAMVADRTTITGSIGVIGISMDASELLSDKIGIDYDEIRFHENANWLSPARPLTADQRGAFEQFIENFYDVFVNRVAESRGMSYDEVHAVAQGRVWSGEDAHEVGLIDYVGGIDLAIQLAAERAELENWSIREFPRQKSFIERLAGMPDVAVQRFMTSNVPQYDEIQMIRFMASQSSRPYAWTIMPYMVEVK